MLAQSRGSKMNDIISWLIGLEATAANLYAEAAVVFRKDEDFSRFLLLLAVEETEHEKLLQQASSFISDIHMKRASFSLDEGYRRKIEAPFERAWQLLRKGQLTKSAMVDILAEAEFSEWNEIFIYTIDTLNASGDEFQKAVSDIDEHRAQIQTFISLLPDGDSFLQRVRRLARPGSRRVLIVEDNHSVARMLEALSVEDVEVVLARNGAEGLSCIQQGHFDLIVSDIEMPKMNGIDMYKQAMQADPSLRSRFIFFTGTENPEHLAFVRSTKTLMLPKPSTVKSICEKMRDVLDSPSVPQEDSIH